MAITAKLKLMGVDALKRKLLEKKEAMERVLDVKLLQIAEEAVTHAKVNKGYKDRTANLKNSISFALYKDGELVTMHAGQIPMPEKASKGQGQVVDAVESYASEAGVVAPSGYTLIIVAGMEYGVYVEHRGYNVLHLTKYYLEEELQNALKETIEEVLE